MVMVREWDLRVILGGEEEVIAMNYDLPWCARERRREGWGSLERSR